MKKKKEMHSCPKTMLVARTMVVLIFLMSAFAKITGFEGQAAYASSSWIGLPGALLIVAAIVIEVFGITALITGWKFKEGTMALAVYILMIAVLMHVGEGQLMNFLKNLAISGGLIAMSMNHPGSCSVCNN